MFYLRNSFFFCFLIIFMTGCANLLKGAKAKPDDNGLYYLYLPKLEHLPQGNPESALRKPDGSLAKTQAEADLLVEANKSWGDISDPGCGANKLYQIRIIHKNATERITNKDFQGARTELEKVELLCPRAGWFSLHYYFEAMVAKGLGESDLEKKKLQQFLDYSAAHQFNTYEESARALTEADFEKMRKELHDYREKAQKRLTELNAPLELSQKDLILGPVKMYPNLVSRPGGNRTPGKFIVPLISYGSLHGLSASLILYKSWGKYSISPEVSMTARLGTFYNIKLRNSFYESENRDTNLDLTLILANWKQVRYDVDDYSNYSNPQVTKEGLNYGFYLGGTRRFFNPAFGLSAQAGGVQNTIMERF